MKINITPNKETAKALLKMAEISQERLFSTNRLAYPSNTLVDYYDILHKLMECVSLQEGVKFKGEGAHRELIEHIGARLSKQEELQLQEMRELRNRISYEGFFVHKNYILLQEKKIQHIIRKLTKNANQGK